MLDRDALIDFADTVCKNEFRLHPAELRELQDAHNVNMCDECDEWFDADTVATDSQLTIMSGTEFLETFVL